jgi:hypothetical protein
MEYQNALQTAQTLLDGEFSEFNYNAIAYCESMGWDVKGKATKKAIRKQGTLSPNANDIEGLAQIIHSIDTESTMEVVENNSVSDFLCNTVAGHITK